MLGAGLFNVGGYFLMMYGISRMGASTAAFVSMLEPIVSVVFGTIWFRLLLFCAERFKSPG